ncbi:alcohol dehydrogenase family protein [Aminobacter ciceronei]|uniref:NADPH:quinone reductase-like Zn-dependent oxidoreductase n=1 Tax=Aminobacter ciceronei TaxID=150723 RepID=A0ABR6CGY9_9HYPH|nr:alcohol dehydrogenase family protein [Aminobacter ciceronei]MBA8910543.1 NADPH:quinone reductase-like Zn-dependent oxidoreductase [Aminobacter ciceronei]MBA9024314.1 NADPH:quinone reductase-like Zn-dependent oxidoreductase [Aminobacter ciceronei]
MSDAVASAATMNAVVLTGHGGIDKLVWKTVPVPVVGDDEVLIKVSACGVNNTDINTRTGWYSPNVKTALTAEIGLNGVEAEELRTWNRETLAFPRIQGADAVGVITAVGKNVDPMRVGKRVMVDPCIRDASLPKYSQGVIYFGSEADGGYAEYTKIVSENAWAVESALSDVELASFACSYSTGEEMLVRIDLQAGETVLVTGASGGVGSANVQLAKRRGARVIAVAGRSKEAAIRALGADEFIPRECENLGEEIEKLVGWRGLDAVADVTGGSPVLHMLRSLRRAGRYVSAGAIAGPSPEIDLRDLIYKDLQMWGVGNPQRSTFASLVGYIERGEIKPVVAKTFLLKALGEAHTEFVSKSHVGKIVITI